MHSLNIIGAGKCGKSLGFLLKNTQKILVKGICNLHFDSTLSAIDFVGQGKPFASIELLPEADIVMLACPDDKITQLAEQLSKTNIKPQTIVFHCSGLRSSLDLSSLKEKGCYVASVHPMISFANPEQSVLGFSGCYCGIEGDENATGVLKKIFFEMGAHLFNIQSDKKELYHSAAVFSSNYLVTLASVAQDNLLECGLEADLAKNIILSLMNSSLNNMQQEVDFKSALTGPIQRGDILTIESHLKNIHKSNIRELYIRLGKETLKLTQHSDKLIKKIKQLFNKD